jgi:hypothetical protein
LGTFVGLGEAEVDDSGSGKPVRIGMELRLRGDGMFSLRAIASKLGVRSRTAPAVLGRESLTLLCGTGDARTPGISRSAIVELDREMMDEMLPDKEWLGRAVIVLEVSVETIESGRGMNSRVSENPTLARPAGFAEGLRCRAGSG